jgi:hypothetical protein
MQRRFAQAMTISGFGADHRKDGRKSYGKT